MINKDEFLSRFEKLSTLDKRDLYLDGIAYEYINAPVIWRIHIEWDTATRGMTTWEVAQGISDGNFNADAEFFFIDKDGRFFSIEYQELSAVIREHIDEIYEMLCDMPELAWDTMRLIEE